MKMINLVYDDDLDDVSILGIPDKIFPDIHALSQEYLLWIPPDDDELGWTIINKKRVLCKETVGFVKWLKDNYCKEEKAVIIKQYAEYDKKLNRIDF